MEFKFLIYKAGSGKYSIFDKEVIFLNSKNNLPEPTNFLKINLNIQSFEGTITFKKHVKSSRL